MQFSVADGSIQNAAFILNTAICSIVARGHFVVVKLRVNVKKAKANGDHLAPMTLLCAGNDYYTNTIGAFENSGHYVSIV